VLQVDPWSVRLEMHFAQGSEAHEAVEGALGPP